MSSKSDSVDSYWTVRRGIKQAMSLAVEELERSLNEPIGTESGACETDYSMQHEETAENELGAETVSFAGSNLTCVDSSDQVCVENDFGNVETAVDSSSESESSDTESLRDSLAGWAMQFNVPKNAVTALLKLLNRYHSDLPLDSRTLHGTPRSHVICSLAGGGQYVHFGLQKGIEALIHSGDISSHLAKLELQFNVDGLPLFKSSNMTLWPILCIVRNSQCKKPFVVGCFSGESKPANLEAYFAQFVTELQNLLNFGFFA